jgi:tetratricopeptide (TPR) repeat protein
MAPEQQRGEEADQSSDLFMVGIIGYLLLTGRHPFAHPSGLFAIPEFIRDDNFTPEVPKPPSVLTTSQQRLFREYAAVVMRLLNREKAGRYASAREALASIEAVTPFQECPQCGERVPEHFTFCGYCGTRVIAPVPTTPTPVPVASVEPSVDELIEEGFLLSRKRRWSDAIARYRQALNKEPGNQKGLRNLGFALNRVGQHEEAEAVLSRGVEIGGQIPAHEASLRFERGLARTELKKYEDALEDVRRALALVPHSIKSLFLRARIHLYKGSLQEARRDAQEVLRSVPDHLGALRMIDQLSKERAG